MYIAEKFKPGMDFLEYVARNEPDASIRELDEITFLNRVVEDVRPNGIWCTGETAGQLSFYSAVQNTFNGNERFYVVDRPYGDADAMWHDRVAPTESGFVVDGDLVFCVVVYKL